MIIGLKSWGFRPPDKNVRDLTGGGYAFQAAEFPMEANILDGSIYRFLLSSPVWMTGLTFLGAETPLAAN